MRIEGNKEFRIYCHDVEGSPLGVLTQDFCRLRSRIPSDRANCGAFSGGTA